MKKDKLVSISDDWYAILFTLIIYLAGWLSIPTIVSIDGLQPNNGFIKLIFNLYSKNSELYIIVLVILFPIITYIMYYIIKYISKKSYENSYSKKDIQNEYSQFLDDAKSVFIFGGKLSFLNQSNDQFEKIKHLGSKCKIICEDITNNSNENKDRYNELINNNVQIRSYSEEVTNNIKNFRGQIKINGNGVMESLFVSKDIDSKQREVFKKINMPNQYLNQMLCHNFNNIFDEGKNPIIGCIVFDLGGVYFDGDFNEDFLNLVNKRLSQNINSERDQKLLLNKRLNLGEIDIVEYIQMKIKRNLSKDEKRFVYEQWKKVWVPNENMVSLVKQLKNNGYKVSVISNLDKQNGDMYRDRGDFDIFDNELFLSYECGLVKPQKSFFMKICDTFNIKPYEVLIIDDHETNINTAKELGMNTIKFCIKNDPTLDGLYENLKNINIKINNQYE